MTARRRSLAAKSIADLEALHAASDNDPAVLQVLREELAHRATERARKLRARLGTVFSGTCSSTYGAARSPSHTTHAGATSTAPRAATQTDEPGAILSAWTAPEALSPQTYRTPENCADDDRSRVAFLGDGLPWARGERSRPDKQLYYQLVLGPVRMDAATQRLVRAFGSDEERRDRARDKAILAAVLVDRHGYLRTDRSIAVSSFGCALPLALDLRLGELGDWSAVERRMAQTLDDMLRRKNDQGQPVPLDAGRIETAYRWLVETFGLAQHLVEPPAFAVRIYHYYRAPNPPEVALLNSFSLTDLSRAQALDPDAVPVGPKRYLGGTPPEAIFDLQLQRSAL